MNKDDLLIRNENIQRIFEWYEKDLFIVNRKYQRKLVWTVEEKQQFVNSILSSYPVPLILLASVDNNRYEIIDGMQRLNSIFSFVYGEFSVEFDDCIGYFDLSTVAITKDLFDNGIIKQKEPVLKRELCSHFFNYQLPLTITSMDEQHVEEVFRRINATGRQLSAQDLRQAGSINPFAELVRKISAAIRRDTSPSDILSLSQMEEISLSNRNLPYGIYLPNIFWVKNGIITLKNMRVSRDEELVAYMLLYILLGEKIAPTAKNLDKIYGYEEDDSLLINNVILEIEKRTPEKIQENFLHVFDQLQKTLGISGENFNDLLFNDQGAGMARSFQILYLAFYNLLSSKKIISDYNELSNRLDGVGTRLLHDITSDRWNARCREEYIRALQGVITDVFADAGIEDPAIDEWISKLENLLMQSKIEQPLFDFKIGLHDLSENSNYNAICLSKIIKTLTAMSNHHAHAVGYVIVGIADNDRDATLFKQKYKIDDIIFNNFHITGVQEEISLKYKSPDEYFMKIKEQIKNEPIEEDIKAKILRNMRLVNYFDKLLLVFSLSSSDTPTEYDGSFYERRATSVEKVTTAQEIKSLYARFA